MSGPIPTRRRRMGALVAIVAGSGPAAMGGVARHLDHPGVQTLWHRLFDIGSAILIVAAIVLLVVTGVRMRRS